MALEGHGRMHRKCSGCGVAAPAFRCKNCVMGPLFCQTCLVMRHALNPLHIVEVCSFYFLLVSSIKYAVSALEWYFFEKTTLKNIGLHAQLGNHINHNCPTWEPSHREFVIIHTNSIHEVTVNFCWHDTSKHNIQLLRLGWWPTMPLNPKTCATLDCLKQFQFLNLQGKLISCSYYKSLHYLTDNMELNEIPVSITMIFLYLT